MAKKGGAGDNSKKAQGQARKADAAAQKAAADEAKKAAAEAADWERGAKKGNAKKEASEEKKAEIARKKAERDALLAEEEKNTPGRSAPKNAKSAQKKTKGLDASLADLDDDTPLSALNASGIENAIDALVLDDSTSTIKLDRRPEKRVDAAFRAWKESTGREKELKAEKLKYGARQQRLWQEFEASPHNPLRQVNAAYNTTREEMREMVGAEKKKIEQRLES